MKRLTDATVFSGFVTAWFLAALPTTRSPSLRKPTTDGVVRSPSALTRISGSAPSMIAMAEFVVPRSMPIILPMFYVLSVAAQPSGPFLSVTCSVPAELAKRSAGCLFACGRVDSSESSRHALAEKRRGRSERVSEAFACFFRRLQL